MTKDEVYQWVNTNRGMLTPQELSGISGVGESRWDYGDIEQKAINPALLRKYGMPEQWGGNQQLKEINGGLYTSVPMGNEEGWGLPGKSWTSAENFYNDPTEEIANYRKGMLGRVVNQDGQDWVQMQDYGKTYDLLKPYANKPSGLDKFLEGIFSAGPLFATAGVLGPLASVATGQTALGSLLGEFGLSNPFSGIGNLFGGGASGAGGGAGGAMGWEEWLAEQMTGGPSSAADFDFSDWSNWGTDETGSFPSWSDEIAGGASGATGGSTNFSNYLKLAGNGSSLLGKLLASGLGAYSANRQANSLQGLADQFASYGAPYRFKLADLYSNPAGFLNSPEVQIPVQQGTDAMARALSIKGNPAGSGNALQQLQSYSADQLFSKLGSEKDRLAGFGGLTAYNAAAPQVAANAVNAQGGTLGAIGGGIADVFNPARTPAQQMAELMQIFRNS